MDHIRLIASDMDATLLDERSQLPPDFAETIRALAGQGILFAAASGRPLYTLETMFPELLEEIILNDWSWYADNHITLHTGFTVTDVDRVRRIVHATSATGETITAEYDRLIMATGSNPFILPIPGKELQGVLAYRDIADTQAMIDAAATYKHAVVIGGGLLGLEAANGLMKRGMQVTVVHVGDWLMERQLDDVAGKMLQKSLAERGMQFLMGAQTQELVGNAEGRVAAVKFKDGTEVPADLVVMAVGIRPNTALAEKMRLHVHRGIVVSDTLQTTTDARIYAVGECAAHRGIAYGLVAPLFEQGKVLANHLAEFGIGRYQGSLTSTKLKVTGIDLFSAGDFQGGEGTEEIVMSDPSGGVYKKLVLKDDKLVGACLYGDTVDGSWYFKLLRDGRSVSDIRDKLMFGESNIGDVGHQGHNKAAAMADSDEVCGCNGVTKGAICKAIKDKGLFTLDEVRKHTKASASCGSCTGLVEQIIMFTAGGDYSATPKTKAMCGCTDHGHQAVRDAIRANKLLSIGDVFSFLEWKTPNGCASCRPAVNYYLISTWPKDAKDDPQSRAINERSHANIQKDGTYSVIPRMWGGETTADELRSTHERLAELDPATAERLKPNDSQRIERALEICLLAGRPMSELLAEPGAAPLPYALTKLALVPSDRAVLHARSKGVTMMFIHALSENTAMLKIARNAGATVKREGSESEAYLELPPADFETHVSDLVTEHLGEMDYQLKKQAVNFWTFLAGVQEVRKGVQEGRHQSAE